MSPPLKVFFGQGAGDGLFLAFDTAQDDSEPFALFAESTPWAPAGMDGEAMFTAFYISLRWTEAETITITPILDGVAYDGTNGTSDERAILALGAAGDETVEDFLLPLSVPLMDSLDPTIEVARFAMRGATIAVRIESDGAPATDDLYVEDVAVEFEIVSDSKSFVGSRE